MPEPPSPLRLSVKKRKISKGNDDQSSVSQFEVKIMDAVSQNASLNPLADFLDFTYTLHEPQVILKAIYALHRIFLAIITQGVGRGSSEKAKIVRQWTSERQNDFSVFLFGLLKDEEAILKVCARFILITDRLY